MGDLISCLMVTQQSHEQTVGLAITDFVRQTRSNKELIIVHDSGPGYHATLNNIVGDHSGIHVHSVDRKMSLGELRNVSVELADGDWICQWDDDDRYHSRRLEVQFQCMQDEGAEFCFLTDQLHLYPKNQLFWDDWRVETPPGHLIQGTIMGSKHKMPRYPSLDKGEDTPVTLQIVQSGCAICELAMSGYLYIYVYNGQNAWDFQHHGAISAWKRFRKPQLESHLDQIKRALEDYGFTGQSFKLPHDDGMIELEV